MHLSSAFTIKRFSQNRYTGKPLPLPYSNRFVLYINLVVLLKQLKSKEFRYTQNWIIDRFPLYIILLKRCSSRSLNLHQLSQNLLFDSKTGRNTHMTQQRRTGSPFITETREVVVECTPDTKTQNLSASNQFSMKLFCVCLNLLK